MWPTVKPKALSAVERAEGKPWGIGILKRQQPRQGCQKRMLPAYAGLTFLSPAGGAQCNLRSPVPTARRSIYLTASPWATICRPYRAFLRHRA